ncbi:MAG: hypothetical protein AAFV53_04165 [Myxococcota bacterium]
MAIIARLLQLQTPDRDVLPIQHADITRADNGDVLLRFKVSRTVYNTIDQQALFHLHPEVRNPSFVGSFSEHQDIEMSARLHPKIAASLSEDGDDALAHAVQAAPLEAPCRQTESYYALSVAQRVHPRIKTGFNTRWAEHEE